ncbi:MAG: hypothetical protein HZA30_04825 [Candidatus Omnitrophica bacterium]|nr:hypothetical protein [Candidatus Omnitrophota bacterium]
MDAATLLAKRQVIVRGSPKIGQVIKGSIVIMRRCCGKSNCRCRNGFKHRSLYVSQTVDGKPRLVYIPKRSEAGVRRLIANYRRLKAVLQKISSANTLLATKAIR